MDYTFNDLKNKVILITGGSGLLGTQFSESFLRLGSKLILLDLKKPSFSHQNLLFIKCNVSNESELIKAFKLIVKKFKKVDVLVNNACKNYSPKKIKKNKYELENFDHKMWDSDLMVGLKGAFLTTKIFGGHMAKNGGGKIINISSDLGLIAPDQRIYKSSNFKKPITYSVIKHGIIGLTKYSATYWLKKNIQCNAIAPGGVKNNQSKKFIRNLSKLIPLGRMANQNEYNFLLLFLASKHSSYLNGSVIVADGGRSIW